MTKIMKTYDRLERETVDGIKIEKELQRHIERTVIFDSTMEIAERKLYGTQPSEEYFELQEIDPATMAEMVSQFKKDDQEEKLNARLEEIKRELSRIR